MAPNKGVSTLRQKRARARRYHQLSIAMSYAAVLALIASIVSVGYQSPVDQQVANRGLSPAVMEVSNPSVDQLVAADLAASTAQIANLAVASNAANLSISLNAKNELAQTDDDVISKPQIFQATEDHRGIIKYTTISGDTVQSIASKFGIGSDTIKWANDLTSDALSPGTKLSIPGTDGVVYVVKSGDTLEKIAKKYKSDEQRIVTYNDLEVSGIRSGKLLVLPGGVLPQNERPGYVAPRPTYNYGYAYNASASVGNRYSYGYCTWYAYNRRAELGRPIGSFWGDAVTWKAFAQASGHRVDGAPAPGSILHDPYSAPPFGHVAIVEEVFGDGSIRISEMNYAGWNVISSRTMDAGQARSYSYIH